MSDHEFTDQGRVAADAIIGRYPQLQSTNVGLLRDLLTLAWVEGRLASVSAEVAILEAQLGLHG